MKLISKLQYQARKNGFDIDKSDGVKIMNTITKKYIHILPTGTICSNDILGHDKDLKRLMKEDFIIKDPSLFSGSVICLPCSVFLHVGKNTSKEDITFATDCLMQSFANIKSFDVVKDENLLPSECMVKHKYVLSYKERQDLINSCLEYLK